MFEVPQRPCYKERLRTNPFCDSSSLANVLEVTEIIKPNKEIYKQNLENKNKD